jgi:hypothetical protein
MELRAIVVATCTESKEVLSMEKKVGKYMNREGEKASMDEYQRKMRYKFGRICDRRCYPWLGVCQ